MKDYSMYRYFKGETENPYAKNNNETIFDTDVLIENPFEP